MSERAAISICELATFRWPADRARNIEISSRRKVFAEQLEIIPIQDLSVIVHGSCFKVRETWPPATQRDERLASNVRSGIKRIAIEYSN